MLGRSYILRHKCNREIDAEVAAALDLVKVYSLLPGMSSNVTSEMLKQSQNRTNRAPLTEAPISSTPARNAGWLATIPTGDDTQTRKPNTDVGHKHLLHLKEISVVNEGKLRRRQRRMVNGNAVAPATDGCASQCTERLVEKSCCWTRSNAVSAPSQSWPSITAG
jgi:hypothetical protein